MKKDTNTRLLYAMRQRNLVYNGDFLHYSNTSVINSEILYNHPDGWHHKDAGGGGLVTYHEPEACCQLTKSSGNSPMDFKQALHEFPRWREQLCGNKVSAAWVISTATPAPVSVSLYDGIRRNTRTQMLYGKEKQRIEVDLLIDPDAQGLFISLQCNASDATIYIHSVCANMGDMALENLPCMVQGIIGERKQYIATETAPATELSLCSKSLELPGFFSRLDSVLNGRFGRGENGRSLTPDMRGYFSRAWDNEADTDPDASTRQPLGRSTLNGDRVGTLQPDELATHRHKLDFDTQGMVSAGNLAPVPIIKKSSTSQTEPYGGRETRSKNISELYTIKWA